MIVNRPGEASFAGIPTFAKLPLALEPSDLAGVDVAILGAPMDETVSNRPGSRYGPRAIRQADEAGSLTPSRPHMLLGVDPFHQQVQFRLPVRGAGRDVEVVISPFLVADTGDDVLELRPFGLEVA